MWLWVSDWQITSSPVLRANEGSVLSKATVSSASIIIFDPLLIFYGIMLRNMIHNRVKDTIVNLYDATIPHDSGENIKKTILESPKQEKKPMSDDQSNF